MTSLFHTLKNLPVKKIQWLMVGLALLIAAQIQYIQHGWINRDSLYYLESARLLAIGEWSQAVKLFQWPFYSALIAAIHKLTTLNIHLCAQILSVGLFGIATYSFLTIIQLAGGGKKELLAGSLILFSSNYMVGDVLAMLMRDQGFWAFFLTSIVFFIRYYKSGTYKDAFFWQLSAIVATLFRIEGITYLILLPSILFFIKEHPVTLRIGNFIRCNFINIIVVVIITAIILTSQNLSMQNFGRLNEIFTANIYHEFTQTIIERSEIMSDQVLGKYLNEYAIQGILLIFFYIVVVKIVLATGIINTGLALGTLLSKKIHMDAAILDVLKATAIISFINMYLIITKVFVLSGRYVLALSLILMIFASFHLSHLLKYLHNPDKRKKWLAITLTVIMLLGIIKNISPKEPESNYSQSAATWLKQNNPSGKPVFYDDSRIRYYAGAPYAGNWYDNWKVVTDAITNNTINNYDFLIISHSSLYPEREKLITEKLKQYHEVKRYFGPKSKKSIVIYERLHTNP